MRVYLVSVLAAAGLTACASEVAVTHNYIPQMGVPGHADYAASRGLTPVMIANSPYPVPAVLVALQRNNPRPLLFTSDPPVSLAGGYRVLLTFDGLPQGGGGLNVCRDPFTAAPSPGVPQNQTSVYGAFCLGTRLLSEAVVMSGPIGSPTDPRFSRLMGDLLSALMPFRDPHGDNRGLCIQNCT